VSGSISANNLRGGDIFGDGVNIAARLEGARRAGQHLCVSDRARSGRGKIDVDFEDLGPQNLKISGDPSACFGWAPRRQISPLIKRHGGLRRSPRHRGSDVRQFQRRTGAGKFSPTASPRDIISMRAGWRRRPLIARNSTFTYKGQDATSRSRRGLGGATSLRQSEQVGRRVRVRRSLIRADTNHNIMPTVRRDIHRFVRAPGRDCACDRRRDRAGNPKFD